MNDTRVPAPNKVHFIEIAGSLFLFCFSNSTHMILWVWNCSILFCLFQSLRSEQAWCNTYISIDWKWCRLQVDNLFSSNWLRKHFKSPPYRIAQSGALQDQGSGFNSESWLWSSTARKTCSEQTNNQLLNLLVTDYFIDLLMLMNLCTPKSVSGCFFLAW